MDFEQISLKCTRSQISLYLRKFLREYISFEQKCQLMIEIIHPTCMYCNNSLTLYLYQASESIQVSLLDQTLFVSSLSSSQFTFNSFPSEGLLAQCLLCHSLLSSQKVQFTSFFLWSMFSRSVISLLWILPIHPPSKAQQLQLKPYEP